MKQRFVLNAAAACLVLLAAPCLPATIAVGPYTPATTPFVVPIVVSGALDLASFAFDLAYDPAQYAIATSCDPFSGDPYCDFIDGPVTQGPFYGGFTLIPALFNPGFVFADASGRQTGLLSGVNGAWQDITSAPSGDGILAYVEFIALVASPTAPIVVPTSTAPPASVPEPTTVTLMFAALAFATLRGRAWTRWFARRNVPKNRPRGGR